MNEIEEPSTAKLALKWGAITGVALILFSTTLYVSNQTSNAGVGAILYLILIVGLVLTMREFKQLSNNYLGYGEGLSLGTLTGAIADLISTMYSVAYTTLIDPGLMERVTNEMRTKLEEQNKLTDAQIDQFVDNMKAFQSPGIQFVLGLLWLVFVGFVFSLVIAAILRRNKPVFD